MKQFIVLFCAAFLLLAIGCDKNPSESIVEPSEQLSEQAPLNKVLRDRLPTTIRLKGRIQFSDGTVYESATETLIELPHHLWARFEENMTLSPNETDYYVVYGENFFISAGSAIGFNVYNYPVNPCYGTWKHRISISLPFGSQYGFSMGQLVYDVKGSNVLESHSDGVFYNPPYSPGTYWSSFTNFSWYFDNDSDIDWLQGVLIVQGSGGPALSVSSFKGHVNGRGIACQ
jgi:hypothetical protein